ncbi:MAG: hypothetical protein D6835_04450 [Candidatus Thermofonsia bacterium]|nr:MAG: hypothetical protein D6835_04450 [Candidatus Thermofonsia bacterium]
MGIHFLGAVGIGLVWGWLIGLVGSPLARPSRNTIPTTLSTLLVTALIWWQFHLVLPFLVTAVLTLTIQQTIITHPSSIINR